MTTHYVVVHQINNRYGCRFRNYTVGFVLI
jgi:hypothetical protein